MSDIKLILRNGNLITMDADLPRAHAVAVGQDGRVVAVGSNSQISNLPREGARVVDLRGRTLIPGFFDCHMHILWLGTNLGFVDLATPPVAHKEDIVRRLRERLAAQPDIACVQGGNYDQNRLPGGQHLTRHDLDRVSTERPVRIVHTSGHAVVVNSRALTLLGFTRETPDPLAGEIVRDEKGEPTGVLLETASWTNLERLAPEQTRAEAVEALGRANRYLLECGITSASDANTPPGRLGDFEEAVLHERLQVRTNCMADWAEIIRQAGERTTPAPDEFQPRGVSWHRLHVGQAKLFSDGAITTGTCWLREPFRNRPDSFGIAMHPPEELRSLIRRAHDAGWQIATHAIGDRAIDEVLTAYEEAQRQNPRFRPGHRIEHAMLLDADLIGRMFLQDVWSVGQPEFILRLGDAYVTALGDPRARRLSPYATLDRMHVAQTFSSDCPVVPGAPLDGMRAAMARQTPSGRVLNADERISAGVALYAYTAAPAFATRTSNDRGAIEEGKWADFTLLSADPMATPVDEWERVQVLATFVGGKCLYGEETL